MTFVIYFFREILLFRSNYLRLFIISVLSMAFLWIATTPETFDSYSDALPVAFAMACASILIGLNLSITMICKNYEMIRRDTRSIPSAMHIVLAKVALSVVLGFVLSIILIFPYLFNAFDIYGLNKLYLLSAVFLTIFTSSAMGLFVSVFSRNKPQHAALYIPFIMLFQILFSGFVFEHVQVEGLDRIAISSYAIRAIGSGMRFDHDHMMWDTPPFAFENSIEHAVENLVPLLGGFIFFAVISTIFLFMIDKRGRLPKSKKY